MTATTIKPSAVVTELLASKAKQVATFTEHHEACLAANAKGDKKTGFSEGAKASGNSAKIRQIELQLAMEDPEMAFWTAWEKPTNHKTRLLPMTQQQVQDAIDKAYRVLSNKGFPESTRHTADKAIDAQLRNAEKRGYSVKDPR